MTNYNNSERRIAYMGGDPVRCPRCSNVVSERFCPFCNLDLSTVYSMPAPKSEDIISTYYHPVGVNKPSAYPQQNIQSQQSFNGQYPLQGQPPSNNVPPPYKPSGNLPYNAPPYNPLYNQQQPYYAPAKKSKAWLLPILTIFIVLVGLAVFTLVRDYMNGYGYFSQNNPSPNPFSDSFSPPQQQDDFLFSGGVSSDEYNKLKVGMSYAQVSSIIGGDGEIAGNGETLKKEAYYVYAWYGETNPNAIVYITITADKVSDISLEGTL